MDDNILHRLYRRYDILRIFHMAIWRKFHYTISSADNSDCLWMENALSMEHKQTKNRILPQKHPKVNTINIPKLTGCFFIQQNLKIYIWLFSRYSGPKTKEICCPRPVFFLHSLLPPWSRNFVRDRRRKGGVGFETRPEKISSQQKNSDTTPELQRINKFFKFFRWNRITSQPGYPYQVF